MSADTNLLLDLTPREVEVIRMALRAQEENHKRNDFAVLSFEVATLRARIADAVIDNSRAVV